MIFTGLEPVLSAWRAIVITNYTKRPLILLILVLITFYKKDTVYIRSGLKRAKAGVEPTASAHEAEILPLNYFAINYMILPIYLEREERHNANNKINLC